MPFEDEWGEILRCLKVEDGRRFIMDNEMDFHDAIAEGQLSVYEVLSAARKHFCELCGWTMDEWREQFIERV